jgi:uncharacterized protein (TIGR03435 family)
MMDRFGFGAVLLLSLVFTASGLGQNAASVLTFDAASVRPSAPDDARGSTFEFPPGGLKVTNGTLMGIIESAFEVRDFQILGAPGWANSDRFDIVARSAAADTSLEISATRRKLQTLLSQRFQLKAHRETRDLPIYVLAVGKGGLKLREAKTSGAPAGIQRACGQMTGTGTSMANLTGYLSRELGRPVQDRTELSARYDFHVDWTPDSGPCPGSATDGPSLFTALQEQLGLKLESAKGPVEVIVIDSVEKPDDN